MPTKPRVVITGAAGFIGSDLAETLLDRGYSVIGIDNLLTGGTAKIAHHRNPHLSFHKHHPLPDPRFHVHKARRPNLHVIGRPRRLRAAGGEPGGPDRLPRAADSHA